MTVGESLDGASDVRRPVRIANFSARSAIGWTHSPSPCMASRSMSLILAVITSPRSPWPISLAVIAQPATAKVWRVITWQLFLQQLTPELETLALRGMKVVTNAAQFKFRPGLAAAAREAIAARSFASSRLRHRR